MNRDTSSMVAGACATLALLLLLLLGSEFIWRSRGHTPSVTDDMHLWAWYRGQVYERKGRPKIVLLGASRAKAGIDPAILHEELGTANVVNLAVSARSPTAALLDLASDSRFSGTVLCATTAGWLLFEEKHSQKPWIEYYHKQFKGWQGLDTHVDVVLRRLTQSHSVIMAANLDVRTQVLNTFRLRPSHRKVLPNRHDRTDFRQGLTADSLAALQSHLVDWMRKRYAALPSDKEQRFRTILRNHIAPAADRLRERGGNVVFVRMPSSGPHWELDESVFPKEKYWERIAIETGAATIHFKDYPSLSGFECPESSHLDMRDVPRFTQELARILQPLLNGKDAL